MTNHVFMEIRARLRDKVRPMSAELSPPNPSCNGIFIIEDEIDIRMAINDVLADEGYPVEHAANGLEALQKLRDRADLPCVILLDLMMPLMNGWEFRDAQMKDARLTDIPVVLLTADGNARHKASLMKAARGLTKPVSLEQLLSTIAEYC